MKQYTKAEVVKVLRTYKGSERRNGVCEYAKPNGHARCIVANVVRDLGEWTPKLKRALKATSLNAKTVDACTPIADLFSPEALKVLMDVQLVADDDDATWGEAVGECV